MTKKDSKVRIAALGDLHVRETSKDKYQELFTEISGKADILVLCGDLTDHGLLSEAEILAKELLSLRIPAVGVLGNHDLEGGVAQEIKKVLRSGKMLFLDDEEYEIGDVGFTGVKGFMGGFDKHALGSLHWEEASNVFVQEAINEALKLENNLMSLKTKYKVVAMHYSPIRETLVGEPPELYPFLGTSRLEDPIDRYDATTVFHGHADYGKPKGKTAKGIPVYNVSYPLMQKVSPKQPYALVEV